MRQTFFRITSPSRLPTYIGGRYRYLHRHTAHRFFSKKKTGGDILHYSPEAPIYSEAITSVSDRRFPAFVKPNRNPRHLRGLLFLYFTYRLEI